MSARVQFSWIVGTDVSYEFSDGNLLFSNLHLSIGEGVYGLVGPNGVGKTTLLHLLSGRLQPTRGTLRIKGAVSFLPQILLLSDDLGSRTLESFLNSEQSTGWAGEALRALGIADLPMGSYLSQLSGGELVKVYLAKLLVDSPPIAILDEPTNNLDRNGREALYRFVREWKGCLIIASHDRELLSWVDHILELSSRGLHLFGGNYDFYLEQRSQEDRAIAQEIVSAAQELRRQKRDLQLASERNQRRGARGKKKARQGGIPKIVAQGLQRKAQKTAARSKSTHESRMVQAEARLRSSRAKIKDRNEITIDVPETSLPTGKEVFEFREFNFQYRSASIPLFRRSLNLICVGPRRIAISGPNGSGKSTLIRALMNSDLDGSSQGKAELKVDRVAYLDQKTELLGEEGSLLEVFSQWTPHLTEPERRIRLGRFLFEQDESMRPVGQLSGGERMRLALACVLFRQVPPQLLILDEPTNNLDLDSIERLESALSHFRGAILVISHDPHFLKNIDVEEVLDVSL